MPPRPTAFISHSSDDSDRLAAVVAYIEELGFQRWMNEVAGGEDITTSVCNAAWEAEAFILALSPAALLSPWVDLETGTALQRSMETYKERPKILPIMLAPVEVPVRLKSLNYIDVGTLPTAEWQGRIQTWAEQHFGDRLPTRSTGPPPPPPPPPTGRRRALLVANSAYDEPRQHTSRDDVEGLDALLADPKIGRWDVERVVDGSTPQVKRAIEQLFGEAGEDDLLMLCISGHSVLNSENTLYFSTSSTRLDDLVSTGLADWFVADQMRSTRARAAVLILDCHHTRLSTTAGAPKESADVAERFTANMAPVEARSGGGAHGRVVISSSVEVERTLAGARPDAVAPGPFGSPFARMLAQGLRSGGADADGDGRITPEELYTYASDRVRALSPLQTPGIFSRMYGQVTVAWSPPPLPEPEVTTTASPPELARGRELARFAHDGAVRGVAFSPDGKLLATCGDDRHWRLWDVDEQRELQRRAHPLSVRPSRALLSVAYSPDGHHVASAACDRTARIWVVSDGSELFRITHSHWVRDVTFSPDGALVASVGDDRRARVWSMSERRKLYTAKSASPLHAVAFSPDSTRLAIAGADGAAQVIALRGGRDPWRASHPASVWDLRFSRDGRFLVTACVDGSARVWDLDEQASPVRPALAVRHTSAVWAVSFHPDGARFATAGDDGTARIWNVEDGRELMTLEHPAAVWQVAFSPDGTQLATASDDRMARVWAV